MGKMKELNVVLERTLERANSKKLARINKEGNTRTKDKAHQIRVKESEMQNTKVMIEKNKNEIGELKQKLSKITGV